MKPTFRVNLSGAAKAVPDTTSREPIPFPGLKALALVVWRSLHQIHSFGQRFVSGHAFRHAEKSPK